MQNLCLGIHKFIFSCPVFFSSFVLLHSCFEKLMDHAPLNMPDQTGLLILRESNMARTHGFVIGPEMWNPWIFSLAKVWINTPFLVHIQVVRQMSEQAQERILQWDYGIKCDCLGRTCAAKRVQLPPASNTLFASQKRGRMCPGRMKLIMPKLPSYWSCRSCFALAFVAVRKQATLLKASSDCGFRWVTAS